MERKNSQIHKKNKGRKKKLTKEEQQQLALDSICLFEYAWDDNALLAKCNVLCRGTRSIERTREVPPCSLEINNKETIHVLILSILLLISGCCCQLPHEYIAVMDRGCLDLVTLAEYLFGLAAAMPWWFQNKCRLNIRLKFHFILAFLGLSYAWLSNLALGYHIPTSVFVSLKNGLLIANLIIGRLFLGKYYSRAQQIAVLFVTLGLIFTYYRAKALTAKASQNLHTYSDEYLPAVLCLLIALFCRAASTAVQERALKFIPKNQNTSAVEMIFMRNLLGLPFFFFKARGLTQHFKFWLEPTNEYRFFLWMLLCTNLCFDYACKILMTRLVATRGALFASLILSMQKFIAFCLSVIFVNPVLRTSKIIWASACLVLLGTAGYAWASNSPRAYDTELSPRSDISIDASSPASSSVASPSYAVAKEKQFFNNNNSTFRRRGGRL